MQSGAIEMNKNACNAVTRITILFGNWMEGNDAVPPQLHP